MATQTAASASTTVFAGNGNYGYNGDNIAATSSYIEYPYGVAADASGNVYYVDSGNSIIRKVDTGGTVHTILGVAQTARTVANGGLNNPLGVAVTDSGNVYVADSTNNVIWEKASSGTVTQVAGSPVGSAGYGNDANGFPLLSGPTGMAYDNATGKLYFSDGGNCRVRVIDTTQTIVSVGNVAGNGTCGFSGDGGQATSAQVNHPMGLAVGNGMLYIADSTSGRVRAVNLSTGVINPFAGNGTYDDTGDGGSATSAAVKTPRGVAVDLVGNVYIGTGSGYVRKVNTSGTISTVAAIAGAINGLARDQYGNIYASTSYYSKIYKFTNASGVTVGTPSASVTASTAMYKMKVSFSLSGVSCPAAASVTLPGGVLTRKTLCNTGDTAPTSASVDVPVKSLDPETGYTVKVTVDDGNGTSPTSSGTLTTPKVPVWIGVGDSFTSGHHQSSDEICNLNGTLDTDSFQYAAANYVAYHSWAGTCLDKTGAGATSLTPNDITFSWVTRAVNSFVTSQNIPTQWKPVIDVLALATNYTNPAQQDNSTCNGCGEEAAMVSALGARAGSWNVVTLEGGANDSDFAASLADFYTGTSGQGQPWAVTSRANCPDTDTLDARVMDTRSDVQTALASVLTAAQTADANVRRVLLAYPYTLNADSGSSVCGGDMTGATPEIGAFHVTDDLDNTITGATVSGVQIVDLRTATGFATNPLSDTQQTRYFGYPHPNSAGQDAIASAVVSALP
jgi:hypothetical protein